MRHIILTFLCATLSLMCMAQAERAVNGVVLDEKGLPVEGAVIQPVGTDWKFNAEADGTFMILVPHYVKELSVGLPGFLSQTLEIDGSYLVFKLKVDKGYAQAKAKAEAEAKEEAERRARAEEAARIAAEKKAAEEAAAQAKAEEAARVAAEKKAAQEAAAQARAEEAARIAAEKAAKEAEEARLAAERNTTQEAAAQARAEEAARIAAEWKAAEDAEAFAKAQKLVERKAINEAYNEKYKNKGFVHSLEFSYGYYTGSPDYFLEYGEYDFLHPVELTYTFGYRFSNWFSLGVGTGILSSMEVKRNGRLGILALRIPVFVSARLYMSRGKYQPLLSLSGGIYAPAMETPIFDAGAGLNIRLSKANNMFFLVSMYSALDYEYPRTYPSFKVGFTF